MKWVVGVNGVQNIPWREAAAVGRGVQVEPCLTHHELERRHGFKQLKEWN